MMPRIAPGAVLLLTVTTTRSSSIIAERRIIYALRVGEQYAIRYVTPRDA
jgi:hypothetical protein